MKEFCTTSKVFWIIMMSKVKSVFMGDRRAYMDRKIIIFESNKFL